MPSPSTPSYPRPQKQKQKFRRTIHNLVQKVKSPKEEIMPGELDSTEVQIARFFGKPVLVDCEPSRSASMSTSTQGSFTPTPSTPLMSSPSSSFSPMSSPCSAASTSSPSYSPTTWTSSYASAQKSHASSTASDVFGRTAQLADQEMAKGIDEMLLDLRTQ